MITITINEDRSYEISGRDAGVEGENNVTILSVTVPERFRDYDKYLKFQTATGVKASSPNYGVEDITFESALPAAVLVAGPLLMAVKCEKPEDAELPMWSSHIISLYVSRGINANEYIIEHSPDILQDHEKRITWIEDDLTTIDQAVADAQAARAGAEAAMDAAVQKAEEAAGQAEIAAQKAQEAQESAGAGLQSELNAKASEDAAKLSEDHAKASENAAKASEQAAANYADLSAVGAHNDSLNAHAVLFASKVDKEDGKGLYSDAQADARIEAQKNAANGIVGTGENGRMDIGQLPSGFSNLPKQNYMISMMPIYLDKKKFNKTAAFSALDVFDAHSYALGLDYGTQNFYKIALDSLEQELLFTTTQETAPYWYCAKILPRYSADYDYVIAYSYNFKKMFRLSTNASAQTGFDAQKLGWLRNTGFDWVPNTSGYATGGITIMYAEYTITTFSGYADTQQVKVWRSTDAGASWTNVFAKNTRNHASPEVYHFHVVRRDPYNAGHWYLSSGDAPQESFIWRSVDDGITWEDVSDLSFTGEKQKIHRLTNMYFTQDYIYWALDDFITADGLGTAWVKANRNIGGRLQITPLANLQNWARQLIKTPYGLVVLTENRPTDNTNALIWLIPHDDLSNPILIAKQPNGAFGNQISDCSYGGRIILNDGALDSLYPKAPSSACMFAIMTLNKLWR